LSFSQASASHAHWWASLRQKPGLLEWDMTSCSGSKSPSPSSLPPSLHMLVGSVDSEQREEEGRW
jgi:hypothetical protein